MGHNADVDIDLADRNELLEHIKYIAARKNHKGQPEKHASGIYVQPIPYDPLLGCSSLHHKEADERGYFKLDLLNVSIYQLIRDQDHYDQLLATEPPWHRLKEKKFVEQIVHISNYHRQISQCMPDNIPRLAMFLAVLRPGKKHLLGKPWAEIGKTVWDRDDTDVEGYSFRQSHAIAYATLVALHMNIINEQVL